MHSGILWFENETDGIERIEKGVKYYVKKYKRSPNLVIVHPSFCEAHDLPKEHTLEVETLKGPQVVKFTIKPYRPVLPGRVWIGIEDKG